MNGRLITIASVALALSACSIADHFQARDKMEKSADVYRSCVAANLKDTSQCEPLKAIYESDKAAFEKT